MWTRLAIPWEEIIVLAVVLGAGYIANDLFDCVYMNNTEWHLKFGDSH